MQVSRRRLFSVGLAATVLAHTRCGRPPDERIGQVSALLPTTRGAVAVLDAHPCMRLVPEHTFDAPRTVGSFPAVAAKPGMGVGDL